MGQDDARRAATWKDYSKTVGSDELGKCIIDVKTNDIYFFDVNLFNIHADFVLGVLLKQAWTADNIREYNKNYERVKPKFILCYLTHHLKVDKWTFSFWEGDKIGADDVHAGQEAARRDVLRRRTCRSGPTRRCSRRSPTRSQKRGLKIDHQRRDLQGGRVPGVHQGPARSASCTSCRSARAYESLNYDRHDIVLLQESYPDITPVAGHPRDAVLDAAVARQPARRRVGHPERRRQEGARRSTASSTARSSTTRSPTPAMTLREATRRRRSRSSRAEIAAAKHVELPKANLDEPAARDADADAREGRRDLRDEGRRTSARS